MKNIAIRLRYTGTNYHGWQVQKNAVTVAGTLESALKATVQHPVKLVGCGRTDAGVHARDYVANFYTDSKIPIDRLPLAINTKLPDDIAVLDAKYVPEDFNAIGSCVKKEYTYVVYNAYIMDPFYINRAMYYPRKLDEEKMRRAAQFLVGEHDFAAMRSLGTDVKSTVRNVHYFDISRSGDIVIFKVCANGFLYNMVRTMVGSMIYVSEGKIEPEDIPMILERKDRCASGPTVPPDGLYLTKLWYGDNELWTEKTVQ